ncbi:doublesex- and mab-3-related transcription factor B1 [Protopterus annectens]|uniref:DMRT6 n=1 Tax=Protopterus annectens TaxID=7888 RepID=A0A2U9NKP3_PROAN|nr:doublesex- and mab-3-related transcription factor B1 [Protopterus annectens]AWT24633.1 DMRT6 [Protopterus annectens]
MVTSWYVHNLKHCNLVNVFIFFRALKKKRRCQCIHNMANVEGELMKNSRTPKCSRCRNHGFIVPVKGHGSKCNWKECQCEKCYLITERQKITAAQKTLKKQLPKEEEIKACSSVTSSGNPGAGDTSSSVEGAREVHNEDSHRSAGSSRMAVAASSLVERGPHAICNAVPSREDSTERVAAPNIAEKRRPPPLEGSSFRRAHVPPALSFPKFGPAMLPSDYTMSTEYLEREAGHVALYRSSLPPKTFPGYLSNAYRYHPFSMHFSINQTSYRGIHMPSPVPLTREGYRHMPSSSVSYPSPSFQMPDGTDSFRATFYSPPPLFASGLFPGIYVPKPVAHETGRETAGTSPDSQDSEVPDSQDSGVMSQESRSSP